MNIYEINFEEAIETCLVKQNGYRQRHDSHYDPALCLDPEMALAFIHATQPEEWAKLQQQYGSETRERFLKRLSTEVIRRGTLDVLRNGIRDVGARFSLAYFVPSSGLNPDLQTLYEGNIFSVVRQLEFSEKTDQSLDLVLFLNGLPIFTAELKNPMTGQNVEHAIRQYRRTRDSREPLFAYGRCLAHFAVDPDLVYMATQLRDQDTTFLPFNKGYGNGAGNPPGGRNYRTAYLWEEIWTRDSMLNLIQHFIHEVEEEDEAGKPINRLIFPRYHQLDSVRRLAAHAQEHGSGDRYLIEHSAGSGKSNSIAWLAHWLSVLHDENDERVFDSIIVITDRRVLDRQLQETVRQFEQTRGIVENIDQTSQQLKSALEKGKTIIVSTLQKFPVIVNEVEELYGQRFAVIIDEAHSSQTGESAKHLKTVLATGSLDEAVSEDADEGPDLEDKIIAEIASRGRIPNVSFFAFTATPKPQTLELFGTQRDDGSYEPFSLYSMRQAIEEGFILDVLENYTTYKMYWRLNKQIEDDPEYEPSKAAKVLTRYVSLHDHAIAEKTRIIVEHFHENVAHRIDGRAKAMLVTRSRLHAVRFKLAMDKYLEEQGYNYRTLVAFSGTIRDDGVSYTESNMNGYPQTQTVNVFSEQDAYRIMIAAYKFQTGFDEPLLHTMYVDKTLRGVNAVQTLSRLNRVYPGKEETMVLDFANEAETIKEGFQPYYEATILSEGTDPNLLYDLELQLESFHFYTSVEIDRYAELYFGEGTHQELHNALEPVVLLYLEATEEERDDFRSKLHDYVRLYKFISQIVTFQDPALEKLYVFGRRLLRALPVSRDELPTEIQKNIEMDYFRIQQTRTGKIELERRHDELVPTGTRGAALKQDEEKRPLSEIIETLNKHFGTDLTEEDRVSIQQLEERLADNEALEARIRMNSLENARLTFEHETRDRFQDMIDSNFKLFRLLNDDEEFAEALIDYLFERYQRNRAA